MSLLQTGLWLYHDAGQRALAGAAALTSENPDAMIDGVVALQMASRTSQIAAKVVQTAQEIDDAVLDMFV